MEELKFIAVNEQSRKYLFASGAVEVKNIVEVCVRPSGSHRLNTADGKKWIIPAGWLALEIDVDHWTF